MGKADQLEKRDFSSSMIESLHRALHFPLVQGHLPSWSSGLGSGEEDDQTWAPVFNKWRWIHKQELELHSVSSDDLLKKLNLRMMLQQNFIQQALLELLLKAEAHVDRVPVLVEPTV